jgi:non-canonical purine NTP pyrophosphatase (RdgB/HAM1 family)
LPAIADDAGMCVDHFGGLPGVDTAYYCTQFGYEKSDDNNVRALLEQMQGVTNRRAAMVSTLVGVRSPKDPEPLIAVGRVQALLTTERRGSNGFGFDPVLLPRAGPDLCRDGARAQACAQPSWTFFAHHDRDGERALAITSGSP